MQVKFFVVPLAGAPDAEAELNAFLRSHRVVRLEKHFVGGETGGYWAVAVEFLDPISGRAPRSGEGRLDYKTILSLDQTYPRLKLDDPSSDPGDPVFYS